MTRGPISNDLNFDIESGITNLFHILYTNQGLYGVQSVGVP